MIEQKEHAKYYHEILKESDPEFLKAFQKEKNLSFIKGRGWDQNDWKTKKYPTKNELDRLFPDIPVALTRIEGHALLVNQAALDLAGIVFNLQGQHVIQALAYDGTQAVGCQNSLPRLNHLDF